MPKNIHQLLLATNPYYADLDPDEQKELLSDRDLVKTAFGMVNPGFQQVVETNPAKADEYLDKLFAAEEGYSTIIPKAIGQGLLRAPRQVAGGLRLLEDIIGAQTGYGKTAEESLQQDIEALQPEVVPGRFKDIVGKSIQTASEQALPILTGTAVGKRVAAAGEAIPGVLGTILGTPEQAAIRTSLAGMGAGVFGESASDIANRQAQGELPTDYPMTRRLLGAGAKAATEVGTELIPMTEFLGEGKSLIRRIIGGALAEVPGEEISNVLSEISERYIEGKPEKDYKSLYSQLFDPETAQVALGSSLLLGAGGHILDRTIRSKEAKEIHSDLMGRLSKMAEEGATPQEIEAAIFDLINSEDIPENIRGEIKAALIKTREANAQIAPEIEKAQQTEEVRTALNDKEKEIFLKDLEGLNPKVKDKISFEFFQKVEKAKTPKDAIAVLEGFIRRLGKYPKDAKIIQGMIDQIKNLRQKVVEIGTGQEEAPMTQEEIDTIQTGAREEIGLPPLEKPVPETGLTIQFEPPPPTIDDFDKYLEEEEIKQKEAQKNAAIVRKEPEGGIPEHPGVTPGENLPENKGEVRGEEGERPGRSDLVEGGGIVEKPAEEKAPEEAKPEGRPEDVRDVGGYKKRVLKYNDLRIEREIEIYKERISEAKKKLKPYLSGIYGDISNDEEAQNFIEEQNHLIAAGIKALKVLKEEKIQRESNRELAALEGVSEEEVIMDGLTWKITVEPVAKPEITITEAAITPTKAGVVATPIEPQKEETIPESPEDKELPPATPEYRLSRWVGSKIRNKLNVTWNALFKAADQAFKGTQAQGKYTPKDAYDAMELGVNSFISQNPDEFQPNAPRVVVEQTIQKLKELTQSLPTQTKRTAEQDEFQQFSTPPAYGYVVNWLANIGKNDVVLEPSAGIGGLAVFAKNAGAKKIYVNELSPRRKAILEFLRFDKVFGENAEHLNAILPKEVAPSVVVMNPPFSATAGRQQGKRDTMVGAGHITQALERLQPGGRLVAIVGEGMAEGKSTFTKWWNGLKLKYNVLANVGVEGKGYAKYGTTFGNQILVIDKTGPTAKPTITGKVADVSELIPILEGVRNGRTIAGEQVRGEPKVEKVPPPSEAKPGAVETLPPPTPELGVRKEPAGTGIGERLPGRPGIEPKPVVRPEIKPQPSDEGVSKQPGIGKPAVGISESTQPVKESGKGRKGKVFSVEYLGAEYAAKGLSAAWRFSKAIFNTGMTYVQFGRKMLAEFGNKIRANLKGMWNDLQKLNVRRGGVRVGEPITPPGEIQPPEKLFGMEMPELVQLAKEIDEGKYPEIKKRVRGREGTLGMFTRGKDGATIKIRADLFTDPKEALRTLAHEVAHNADWIPDKVMARGNLLGRLAKLVKFMRNRLEGIASTNKEIREELISLTKSLSPYDERFSPPSYVKYRENPKELYAEGLSEILVDPEGARRKIPKFFEAFFDFIGENPQLEESYYQIQDLYRQGEKEVAKRRLDSLNFDEAEEVLREMRKPAAKELVDTLTKTLLDKNSPIYKLQKQAREREGGLLYKGKLNPVYAMEEAAFTPAEVSAWLTDLSDAKETLNKSGMEWDTLGQKLFLDRVMNEEYLKTGLVPGEEAEPGGRANLANPKGFNKETAKKTLDFLEATLGKEKTKTLNETVANFREKWKYVMERLKEGGILADGSWNKLSQNPYYATFQVYKWMENINAKIFEQTGTFSDITNPATATVEKGIAIIKYVNQTLAKKEVVGFLFQEQELENLPKGIIKEAEYSYDQNTKRRYPIEPKDPRLGLIQYLDQGKMKGYIVEKGLADMFTRNAEETAMLMRILAGFNRIVKNAFVTYNPGFQMFNIIRDYFRAVKGLQGANLLNMLPSYWRTFQSAKKAALGESDSMIRWMKENKMLLTPETRQEAESEEKQIDYLLKSFQASKNSKIDVSFKTVFGLLDLLKISGGLIENWSKIASADFLKAQNKELKEKGLPEMPVREIAYRIRNRVGTPNSMRKGSGYWAYNNLWLFSNIFKEGIRSDLETFKEMPLEYSLKTIKYNILPKLILAALAVASPGWKKWLERIPLYDWIQFGIVPLPDTVEGKSTYLRIPQDEMGRLISGLFFHALNLKRPSDMAKIFEFGAGQMPGLSPFLGLGVDWAEYLSGKNPYDWFRQREVIEPRQFKAGAAESLPEMFKHSWQKLGGDVIYKFPRGEQLTPKSTIENLLATWQVSNLLGRFVKVTDRGISEKIQRELEPMEQARAKETLEQDKIIYDLLRRNPQATIGDARQSFNSLAQSGKIVIGGGKDRSRKLQSFMARFKALKNRGISDAYEREVKKLPKYQQEGLLKGFVE